MSDHPMGWALTWALTWAVSGPGPYSRPLRFIERGAFHHTEFIEVVGLGSNLTGYAGVVGLGRLLALMAYVGDMRCRLSPWRLV